MAPARIVFLAGAPDARSLDWSDKVLTRDLGSCIKRFLGTEDASLLRTPLSTQDRANWRAVALDDNLFYQSPVTRKTQRQQKQIHKHHGRITFQEVLGQDDGDDDDDDEEFLEHSFAIHAEIQSSMLAPHSLADDEEEMSTFITEDSVMSTTCMDYSTILDMTELQTPAAGEPSYHRFAGQVMNIKAIPSAEDLQRLQPQTMTVNLIAGVISIAPPRTVRVRRGNYDMDIVEITLGDETKAGFTVSSWHSPADSQNGSDPLRDRLRTIRPQDIILIEQLALSSFRGQVFGQSLNRKVSKNATRITVICKSQALLSGVEDRASATNNNNAMLSSHVANKLQRVKDWVIAFIGPGLLQHKANNVFRGGKGPSKRNARGDYEHAGDTEEESEGEEEEYLPPDSQT